MDIVLLVSGGLDSYIAKTYLEFNGDVVIPLFINYHGRYTAKEKKICLELYPNLKINNSLYLGRFEYGEKAFIKNRNIYFALIASNYGQNICMAGLQDDNVGDKSPEAFNKMQDVLSEVNVKTYSVFSPFWRKTKTQIIDWYLRSSNLPIKTLVKTTSCYHPTKLFCGECPSCFRKWCAFQDNHISSYLPSFTNKNLVHKYIKNLKLYDQARQKSILSSAKIMGVLT